MLHLVVTSLNPPFIYNGSSIQPSAEHWVMLLRSPWLIDQHWELMRDAVSGSPLPPALSLSPKRKRKKYLVGQERKGLGETRLGIL